jgi:hypothetical protein
MLYSHNKDWPQSLPNRIRLSSGATRTGPAFTAKDLADAGYVLAGPQPALALGEKLSWSGTEWVIRQPNDQETTIEWNEIRRRRDKAIQQFEWRYARHHRELRLGVPPTDSLQDLDNYVQALADITLQENPFTIVWPTYTIVSDQKTGDQ